MPSFDENVKKFSQHSLIFKGNSPRSVKWLKSNIKYLLATTGIQKVKDINVKIVEDWIYKGKFEKERHII
jgi:hypothetical protein